ncbi:MAG: DUF4159 domain-containing protein [Pirellulaceae bacterium]
MKTSSIFFGGLVGLIIVAATVTFNRTMPSGAESPSVAIQTTGMMLASQQEQEYDRRGKQKTLEQQDDQLGFNSQGYPIWKTDRDFKSDVFTFARVRYTSGLRGEELEYRGGRFGRRFYKWDTDFPDSDNNFSFRLHELTSLQVNPEPVIVTLDGDEIFNYPFVYLIEPGHMALTEDEVLGMRKYLLRGGFMMIDDFWGEWEYETLALNLKRVFPDRTPQELPIEHEIFNIVYTLKEKPMVPSIHHYYRGMRTERRDAMEAHYRGLFDDNGRLMMVICHNTDLGDGWEREGVDEGYFNEFSEKYAYPLGINIIVYAMTH